MTHLLESNLPHELLQLLSESESGQSPLAAALRLLLNEAMKVEREAVLGAKPYERAQTRTGSANSFKPKTLNIRPGPIELAVPQVRGDVEFYPSALERGVRSERALKLAIAEMYVQGVSTRKVTQVLEQMCGLEVSRPFSVVVLEIELRVPRVHPESHRDELRLERAKAAPNLDQCDTSPHYLSRVSGNKKPCFVEFTKHGCISFLSRSVSVKEIT